MKIVTNINNWKNGVLERLGKLTTRQKFFWIVYMMLLFVTVVQPASVYAGTGYNWAKDADSSIYGGKSDDVGGPKEEAKNGKGIEKFASKLLVAAGQQLQKMFADNHMSINNIIFGRVNGYSDGGVAYYTYDLSKGNPYGVVSMMIYKVMAQVMLVVIVLIGVFRLVQTLWSSGNGQARQRFKDSMRSCALSFGILSLMPSILSLVLYLRDLFIYVVAKRGSSLGINFSSQGGIVDPFYDKTTTNQIIPALMYLGIVCITLFFMFEYVGMAMAMMVMVICFPFITVEMNFNKSALSGWMKSVLSVMVTPVMDIMLIMLPLAFGDGNEHALLQLTLCWLVIPSRNVVKQVLGLSSPGSGLLSGFAALSAIRLAAHGASRIGNRAMKTASRVKGAHDDFKSARTEKELGKAEREDFTINAQRNKLDSYDPYANSSKKPRKNEGFGGADDGFGTNKGKKYSSENQGMKSRIQKFGGNVKEQAQNFDKKDFADNLAGRMSKADKKTNAMKDRMNADAIDERNQLNNLKMTNSDIDSKLEQKKSQRSALQNKINANKGLAGGAARAEMKRDQEKLAGIDTEISKLNGQKAANNQEIGRLNSRQQAFRSMGVGSGAGGGKGSLGTKQQETLSKLANINNFEQPEFSSLSHDQKARLHRNRAINSLARGAVSDTAALVGGAGGAVLGAGATTFGGATMQAGAIAAGSSIGAETFRSAAVTAMTTGVASGHAVAGVTNFVVDKLKGNNGGNESTQTIHVTAETTPISEAGVNLDNIDISGLTQGVSTSTNVVVQPSYSQGQGGTSQTIQAAIAQTASAPSVVNYTIDDQILSDTISSFSFASGTNTQETISNIIANASSDICIPKSAERIQAVNQAFTAATDDLANDFMNNSYASGNIPYFNEEIKQQQIEFVKDFIQNDPSSAGTIKGIVDVELANSYRERNRSLR